MKTVLLGDVSESVDYGLTASAAQEPVGPRFLRITDIQDGTVDWGTVPWCVSSSKETQASRLAPGDIVFARTGATTGKSFLIRECPDEAVFASYLIRVRLRKSVNAGFVSHFFRTPKYWAQISKAARGVAQPGVNATTLRALELPLPPLDEQRRIAEVLDRAEALRAKRRAALAQLDTLTQSIFLDLFGDPVVNERRLTTLKLEGLCRRITDGTHQSPKWTPSGIPFLFISNIVDGEIDFQTDKYISPETHAELTRRCPIEVGDVLYTTVGSYGNVALVRDARKFAFQRHVAHVKPDLSKVEPAFLAAMLSSPGVKRQVDVVARGVAQKTVNLGSLRELIVFDVPLARQRSFAATARAIENLKSAQRRSLAELDALFASLQHRAFRGEL